MFGTNRIIRYINQNRRKILLTIGIIAGIIIVIQTLNSIAKNSSKNKGKLANNNVINTSVYQPSKTVISGENVEEKKSNANEEIIDQFVKNCKEGNLENAYELLTDECKEVLFPTIERFNDYYYKKIFTGKSNYSLQSWISYGDNYTYKIRYTIDLLSTGNADIEPIEDYITIVNNNGENKLNINSYIGRRSINKTVTSNDITYNVKFIDIYMDKEEYFVNVKNDTMVAILLDSLETVDGIKLFGNSDKLVFQAYTNEFSEYDVTIPAKNTKTVRIKFAKDYNPKREAKKIAFSDIVLNKEEYKKNNGEEINKDNVIIEF